MIEYVQQPPTDLTPAEPVLMVLRFYVCFLAVALVRMGWAVTRRRR